MCPSDDLLWSSGQKSIREKNQQDPKGGREIFDSFSSPDAN